MTSILLLAALLTPAMADAAPYFRLIDPKSPSVSAGAAIDIEDPEQTSVGTVLALVTHSPKDGCAFPRLACVDWTPLGIGYFGGGGHHRFGFGPSANLAPIVRQAIYNALGKYSRDDRYSGLKSTLSPAKSEKDLSIAFGPAWVMSPTASPGLRVFAGARWEF